jgi:hypothetical protein
MPRMTNKLARETVNKWLAEQGKKLPWFDHTYVDFVTEVRNLTGIDPQENAFDVWDTIDACQWLRVLAMRIRDGVPIGNTLMQLEQVH